jgi:hypothetical protein
MLCDLDARKSTSGFVFKAGGTAVTWGSKLQKLTALSTLESEFVSIYHICALGYKRQYG